MTLKAYVGSINPLYSVQGLALYMRYLCTRSMLYRLTETNGWKGSQQNLLYSYFFLEVMISWSVFCSVGAWTSGHSVGDRWARERWLRSSQRRLYASSFPDDVSAETKKKRLAIVQQRLNSNTEAISKSMIGSTQKVLVEGFSKKGNTLSGRTENMRTAHFEGGEELIGKIVSVRILEGIANSLKAELV